jgi:hypothetical protein
MRRPALVVCLWGGNVAGKERPVNSVFFFLPDLVKFFNFLPDLVND